MLREAVTETVNRLFNQIDSDKTGFLSSKEIDHFVKEVIADMGENSGFKEDDIQGFIENFVMGMFSAMG